MQYSGPVLGADYSLWVRTMKQMAWLPKIAINYCSGYQDPVIAKQLAGDADFFMGSTAYSPQFASLMPAVGQSRRSSSPRPEECLSTVTASRKPLPCWCLPRRSKRPAIWILKR